jgi:hypothetical protein
LFVNGERKGTLSSTDDRLIELMPGAYRFEARSDGSTAAVKVATVRPDTPMDISLTLPSGTTDPFGRPKEGEAGDTGQADTEASPEQPETAGDVAATETETLKPAKRLRPKPVRRPVRRAAPKRPPAPVRKPQPPPAAVETKPAPPPKPPAETAKPKPPPTPKPPPPPKPPPEDIPDNPF